MFGGSRLLLCLCLSLLILIGTVAFAGDDSTAGTSSGPPKAKLEPVEDTIHGHKIVDPYRYLENSASPETQQYVTEQLAYVVGFIDRRIGSAE